MYRISQFDQSLFLDGFPKQSLLVWDTPFMLIADADETDNDTIIKTEIIPIIYTEFLFLISCICLFISICYKTSGTFVKHTRVFSMSRSSLNPALKIFKSYQLV